MERRKQQRRSSDRFSTHEDRRRAERRDQTYPPERISPATDPSETIERLVSRKQLQVESGDVVIERERMPRLQPSAPAELWWFRVRTHPGGRGDERVFTSFH